MIKNFRYFTVYQDFLFSNFNLSFDAIGMAVADVDITSGIVEIVVDVVGVVGTSAGDVGSVNGPKGSIEACICGGIPYGGKPYGG